EEIALLLAPSTDSIGDTADKLPDRGLTRRTAERTAKILRNYDIGSGLGPAARYFDVALFEDHAAVLTGDDGRPQLPFDLGHRVDARTREVAFDLDTFAPGDSVGLSFGRFLGHLSHPLVLLSSTPIFYPQ